AHTQCARRPATKLDQTSHLASNGAVFRLQGFHLNVPPGKLGSIVAINEYHLKPSKKKLPPLVFPEKVVSGMMSKFRGGGIIHRDGNSRTVTAASTIATAITVNFMIFRAECVLFSDDSSCGLFTCPTKR